MHCIKENRIKENLSKMQKLTIDRIHVHLFHTCNQLIMGYFIKQFLSINLQFGHDLYAP